MRSATLTASAARSGYIQKEVPGDAYTSAFPNATANAGLETGAGWTKARCGFVTFNSSEIPLGAKVTSAVLAITTCTSSGSSSSWNAEFNVDVVLDLTDLPATFADGSAAFNVLGVGAVPPSAVDEIIGAAYLGSLINETAREIVFRVELHGDGDTYAWLPDVSTAAITLEYTPSPGAELASGVAAKETLETALVDRVEMDSGLARRTELATGLADRTELGASLTKRIELASSLPER